MPLPPRFRYGSRPWGGSRSSTRSGSRRRPRRRRSIAGSATSAPLSAASGPAIRGASTGWSRRSTRSTTARSTSRPACSTSAAGRGSTSSRRRRRSTSTSTPAAPTCGCRRHRRRCTRGCRKMGSQVPVRRRQEADVEVDRPHRADAPWSVRARTSLPVPGDRARSRSPDRGRSRASRRRRARGSRSGPRRRRAARARCPPSHPRSAGSGHRSPLRAYASAGGVATNLRSRSWGHGGADPGDREARVPGGARPSRRSGHQETLLQRRTHSGRSGVRNDHSMVIGRSPRNDLGTTEPR